MEFTTTQIQPWQEVWKLINGKWTRHPMYHHLPLKIDIVDLLGIVLEFISIEDRVKFAQVCKFWCVAVSRSKELWIDYEKFISNRYDSSINPALPWKFTTPIMHVRRDGIVHTFENIDKDIFYSSLITIIKDRSEKRACKRHSEKEYKPEKKKIMPKLRHIVQCKKCKYNYKLKYIYPEECMCIYCADHWFDD